jgi:hypothetical protein
MTPTTKTRLQILPGSTPGKIRIVGDKSEAEAWLPRIHADKAKIMAVTLTANELIHLILQVGVHYEFTPEEASAALSIAARDPANALASYRLTHARLIAAGEITP